VPNGNNLESWQKVEIGAEWQVAKGGNVVDESFVFC